MLFRSVSQSRYERQSTTAQGNAFRDAVAALLRAAHLENVETEKRIGSKKVDVYFEEPALTKPRRTAVECKDYSDPLTKTYLVNKVFPEYRELINAQKIDALLVVGRVPLNADARTFVDETPELQYRTFTELLNRVMDFGSYVQAMSVQFNDQGLSSYYVRPNIVTGKQIGRAHVWNSSHEIPSRMPSSA